MFVDDAKGFNIESEAAEDQHKTPRVILEVFNIDAVAADKTWLPAKIQELI